MERFTEIFVPSPAFQWETASGTEIGRYRGEGYPIDIEVYGARR